MLQRAASNAYSWWWASHIRTKQSKWLDQSLQDMEEKVQNVLKLIEGEADSFAKRAEMYYKKRPEIVNFVEESYRAFRALAQRYDHLSTELQNANNTLATVFPDKVQYEMDDEDDEDGSPRPPKNFQVQPTNVPKAPADPNKNFKGVTTPPSKKIKGQDIRKASKEVPKSGLSETQALEEIDKLQKEVLTLQTVKEFVKSSYESGLEKYWNIESQITEKQEKVFNLQDEFKVGKAIEDDEARSLMADTALKSCLETLTQLQEKQERSAEEAKEEYKRIQEARQRLKSLKQELSPNQDDEEMITNQEEEPAKGNCKPIGSEKNEEVTFLGEKIKEHFNTTSNDSFTVTQLAERIDELVNKVISLESAVASQTAMIDRMRTETDCLYAQLKTLEDDKLALTDNAQDLSDMIKEVEGKLNGIQDLNQNVENQNSNLQTHFTEARSSLNRLSEKLQTVKPDEEIEEDEEEEKKPQVDVKEAKEEPEKQNEMPLTTDDCKSLEDMNIKEAEDIDQEDKGESTIEQAKQEEGHDQKAEDVSETSYSTLGTEPIEKEADTDWQKMLLSGLEDRETILLREYTTILRSYKDVKKKMSEEDKKNRDTVFEISRQVRELRAAVANRDQEIASLRQKLSIGETTVETLDPLDDRRAAKPEAGNEDSSPSKDEDINLILIDPPQTISLSPIEEKLRMNIDAILDENLDFWLRFSTSFHQIQKFRNEVQDLQKEIMQLKENKGKEGSKTEIKSDVRPIYKHMREIHTELTVWIEHSGLLKEELQQRFSSLCNIQEEIAVALKEGVAEEQIRFTTHQAAKLQGEVLNMKQENNKVSEELEAGFDHASILQLELEKTLAKLDEEFNITGKGSSSTELGRASTARVPLRSFIFGSKHKKHKNSIFSCMHPNRKIQIMRSGVPM